MKLGAIFHPWASRARRAVPTDVRPNIRGFDLAVVHVLGRLYDNFPTPINFSLLHEHVSLAVDEAQASRTDGETYRSSQNISTKRFNGWEPRTISDGLARTSKTTTSGWRSRKKPCVHSGKCRPRSEVR